MDAEPSPLPTALHAPGLSWKKFVLELPVPAGEGATKRPFDPLVDEPVSVIAQAALGFLATRSPPDFQRELGRAISAAATPASVGPYVAAFAAAGLGHIDVENDGRGRYRFTSRDLPAGDAVAKAPGCHLALGFVEGLARAYEGREVLGSEVECRRMGHAQCVFHVKTRG